MLRPLTTLRHLRLDSTHFTGEKTRDKRGHGLNKAAAGKGGGSSLITDSVLCLIPKADLYTDTDFPSPSTVSPPGKVCHP